MNKLLFILIPLFLSTAAVAQKPCEPRLEFRVNTASGLKLRQGPGHNFPVVTYIPTKSYLLVCEELDAPATFEGVAGHWRRVKYKDKYGYMFDGFLAPVGASAVHAESFKLAQLLVINRLIAQDASKLDSVLRYLNSVATILGYEQLIGKPKKDIDSLFVKTVTPAATNAEPKQKPEPEQKPEPVVKAAPATYHLLTETMNYCGDIRTIDPGLIWYVVYRKGDVFYRTRAEILVVKSKYSLGKGLEFDVRAETQKEVSFMLSSEKLLDTNWSVYQPFTYFVENPNKLFPGQQTELYARAPTNDASTVTLFATGAVVEVGACPVLENYKLKITGDKNETLISQDLTPLFSYMGQCGMPEIYWFGDINNDQLADIIFVSVGDAGTLFTLLISDDPDPKKLYRKAAEWFNKTCE